MKKIIGILRPFDMYQTFYVYQDGNKLDIVQTRVGDIPQTVLELSNTYEVYQIDLSGAEQYAKGIVRQIQELEMTKYHYNKLTFNYI